MGIGGGNRRQVPQVFFIPDGKLHIVEYVLILFLKYLRINAIKWLASRIILLVLCHLINEEEGQHLDPLVEQLALPFKVGKDGLPDLKAAQLFLTDPPHDLTGKQLQPVQKLNMIVPSVDELHHKAVPVLLQSAGMVIEIVTNPYCSGYLTDTLCALTVKLDGGGGISFGKIDTFQIDIALVAVLPDSVIPLTAIFFTRRLL